MRRDDRDGGAIRRASERCARARISHGPKGKGVRSTPRGRTDNSLEHLLWENRSRRWGQRWLIHCFPCKLVIRLRRPPGMKRMLARAFRRRREIPCSAQKIPCTFPAGRKIFPCSPTQGILPQASRIQGLFGAYLGEKARIPCKFAARREFFPLAYLRGRMTGLEFLSSRESDRSLKAPDVIRDQRQRGAIGPGCRFSPKRLERLARF